MVGWIDSDSFSRDGASFFLIAITKRANRYIT